MASPPQQFPPSSAVDDEDDPIVAEYVVVAAQQLSEGGLHLFQYPLRPSSRPYEATSRTLVVAPSSNATGLAAAKANGPTAYAAAIANQTSRFQIDVELDVTGNKNFAGAASSNASSSSPHHSDFLMNDDGFAPVVHRYTLESHPAPLSSTYVAALFVGSEIHLTPISSIQSFTPLVKKRGGSSVQESLFQSALTSDVSSGVMRNHLERQLFRFRSAMLAKDFQSSHRMELFGSETVESQTVANKLAFFGGAATGMPSAPTRELAASAADPRSIFFSWKPSTSDETFRSARPMLLRYSEDTHSLEQQVASLLASAKVLSLADIVKFTKLPSQRTPDGAVRPGTSAGSPAPESILPLVRRHAVYLRGAWVVAFDTTFRSASAVIREFILLHFAKSADGSILRSELLSALPPDPGTPRATESILNSVAVRGADRRWRIKGTEDGTLHTVMRQNHPAEVAAQEAQWERRSAEIIGNVDTLKSGRVVALKNLRLIQSSGGSSTPGVSASQSAAATPTTAMRQPLPTASAIAEPPSPALQTARQFFRQLFHNFGVLNTELAKERIATMRRTPTSMIYGIAQEPLKQAAQELVATFTPSTWILRSVDPATDVYRRALVVAMRQTSAFTAADIITSAQAVLRRDNAAQQVIPPAIAQQIISELAEYHGGEKLWHVRTGMVNFTAVT